MHEISLKIFTIIENSIGKWAYGFDKQFCHHSIEARQTVAYISWSFFVFSILKYFFFTTKYNKKLNCVYVIYVIVFVGLKSVFPSQLKIFYNEQPQTAIMHYVCGGVCVCRCHNNKKKKMRGTITTICIKEAHKKCDTCLRWVCGISNWNIFIFIFSRHFFLFLNA